MGAQITLVDGRDLRVASGLELRAAAAGGGKVLAGRAASFNVETQIGGNTWGWREVLAPGCFATAIVEDDIRALINHDANLVIGRNKAGTLRLRESDQGLEFEVDVPDTAAARDLVVSVERGDVSGMSFQFSAKRQEWIEPDDEDGLPLRRVLECRLYDIAVVTFPAYPDTTVSVRSAAEAAASTRRRAELDARQTRAVARLAIERAF